VLGAAAVIASVVIASRRHDSDAALASAA